MCLIASFCFFFEELRAEAGSVGFSDAFGVFLERRAKGTGDGMEKALDLGASSLNGHLHGTGRYPTFYANITCNPIAVCLSISFSYGSHLAFLFDSSI